MEGRQKNLASISPTNKSKGAKLFNLSPLKKFRLPNGARSEKLAQSSESFTNLSIVRCSDPAMNYVPTTPDLNVRHQVDCSLSPGQYMGDAKFNYLLNELDNQKKMITKLVQVNQNMIDDIEVGKDENSKLRSELSKIEEINNALNDELISLRVHFESQVSQLK